MRGHRSPLGVARRGAAGHSTALIRLARVATARWVFFFHRGRHSEAELHHRVLLLQQINLRRFLRCRSSAVSSANQPPSPPPRPAQGPSPIRRRRASRSSWGTGMLKGMSARTKVGPEREAAAVETEG
nr:unnamed protein product [Digitaria exilis]